MEQCKLLLQIIEERRVYLANRGSPQDDYAAANFEVILNRFAAECTVQEMQIPTLAKT